ncbi:hypothetical protein ABZ260_22220 [Streptosporangium sp. NPDC006013]|uniref:hypothetical protein n=1 Tax=Streptosporangium sp. NPDC006013 TaxID=3155596 RepID=UPI0033B1CDB8
MRLCGLTRPRALAGTSQCAGPSPLRALITALVQGDKALTEILAEAIKTVTSLHDFVCDLIHPDSPSATVVILRRTAGALDYLDSVLVLNMLDTAEPLVVCDEREAEHDDPDGSRWPRAKAHDDATAALWKLC